MLGYLQVSSFNDHFLSPWNLFRFLAYCTFFPSSTTFLSLKTFPLRVPAELLDYEFPSLLLPQGTCFITKSFWSLRFTFACHVTKIPFSNVIFWLRILLQLLQNSHFRSYFLKPVLQPFSCLSLCPVTSAFATKPLLLILNYSLYVSHTPIALCHLLSQTCISRQNLSNSSHIRPIAHNINIFSRQTYCISD